jgi:TonB family protein
MNYQVCISILGLLFAFCQLCEGQTVSGVIAHEVDNTIQVDYKLRGISTKKYDVGLYYSLDDGRTFTGPLKMVSGNVGPGQRVGTGSIIWDVLKEEESLIGSLVFEVRCSEEDEIFMIVEKMPAFPGCEGKRGDDLKACTELEVRKYTSRYTKYPQIAKDAGISGTVYVYYEINKKGKIENAEILRGVHKSLDSEALRVIKNIPTHTPGEQRGKPVRVRYTVPVKFILR